MLYTAAAESIWFYAKAQVAMTLPIDLGLEFLSCYQATPSRTTTDGCSLTSSISTTKATSVASEINFLFHPSAAGHAACAFSVDSSSPATVTLSISGAVPTIGCSKEKTGEFSYEAFPIMQTGEYVLSNTESIVCVFIAKGASRNSGTFLDIKIVSNSGDEQKKGIRRRAIIGIALGSAALLILIIVVVMVLIKKKKMSVKNFSADADPSFELEQIEKAKGVYEPQERASKYEALTSLDRMPGTDSYILVADQGEHSIKIAEHTRATCRQVRVLKIVKTEVDNQEESKTD